MINISEWEAQGKFWGKCCKRDFRKSLLCLARSGIWGELRSAPSNFHVAKRTDVEAEAPILWPPDAKSWITGKDPDAGKDWGQEEKGMTEDEMVGWHHWLDGHEFEQAPGVGDGQGGLACCSPWGCRVRHDWVTDLTWSGPLRPLHHDFSAAQALRGQGCSALISGPGGNGRVGTVCRGRVLTWSHQTEAASLRSCRAARAGAGAPSLSWRRRLWAPRSVSPSSVLTPPGPTCSDSGLVC